MSILKPSTWNIPLPFGYLLAFGTEGAKEIDFTYKGVTTPYKQVMGVLYKKVKV